MVAPLGWLTTRSRRTASPPLNSSVMRRALMKHFREQSIRALVVATVCCNACAAAFGAPNPTSAMMAKARAEIGRSVAVPVYLPTRLPASTTEKITSAAGAHTAHGYTVTLCYLTGAGDAGYAGLVSGSTDTFASLSNTKEVRLANGTAALFRPVSCGASCAPAHLWWQVSGHEYSVQLRLPSLMAPKAQLAQLLLVANSMARQ